MPLDRSILDGIAIFDDLGDAAKTHVLSHARAMRVEKDAAIFSQGEEASSFFLLLHGHLRVFRITPDGRQVVIRFVVPGELFGIAVAMGKSLFPANAVAVQDSVVLAWPNTAWDDMVAHNPALARIMMQTMGSRLEDSHDRVVEMSTQQVERRVARAVVRLAGSAGRETEDGILIDMPLSREDLAQMTGTTLFTVSRLISGWEAAGYVQAGRQKLLVRRPHKLFMLAEGRMDEDRTD